MKNTRRGARAGFTLTELLVVIAIIAMLAGLITVAAVQALDTAKQVAVKSELDQLDMAMKSFKDKYGDYPPCDLSFYTNGNPGNNPALIAFIMRAFPRYNPGTFSNTPASSYARLQQDFATLGVYSGAGTSNTKAYPDRALVFWLSGFSADPTSPFTGAGARTPFFQFDQTRLINMTTAGGAVAQGQPASTAPATGNMWIPYIGQVAYVPKYGNGAPFAYIDNGHYGQLPGTAGSSFSYIASNVYTTGSASATISTFNMNNTTGTSIGVLTPYVQDLQSIGTYSSSNVTAYQFCNPTTFQIIAASQDGEFGTPIGVAGFAHGRLYPSGSGYSADGSETDNVANFCDKARLGDAIP